jgi:hypothetical protein
MTASFDAASASAQFIQPAGSANPVTWTHTPAGTPRGVWVGITQADTTTDNITGVTYGGVAMTRIPTNGYAVDNAIEVGAAYQYFLGTGIPTGAQTVSVSYSNDASVKRAVCFTVAGSADMEVVASGMVQGDAANPSVALNSGTRVALKVFALYSGRDIANLTNPAGITRYIGEQVASSARSRAYGYRTTPASGSETVSQTGSSDDAAMVAAAIAEVVGTSVNAEHAAGTVAAYGASPKLGLGEKVEVADFFPVAYDADGAVKTNAGAAAATVAAHNATAQASQSTTVNAGHASVTVWATEGESSELDADAPVAAVTVAAHDAEAETDSTIPPAAEIALVAVAAHTPAASVAPAPAAVLATAEAHDAHVAIGIDASLASVQATAIAHDATVAVVDGTFVPAPAAEAAIEAYDAAARVDANLEHAAALAAAFDATVKVGASAGAALVGVTAYQAAIAIASHPGLASVIAAAYPDAVAVAVRAGLVTVTAEAYDKRDPFTWRGSSAILAVLGKPTGGITVRGKPTATIEVEP